jgi:hypothetical protein
MIIREQNFWKVLLDITVEDLAMGIPLKNFRPVSHRIARLQGWKMK